MNLFAFFSRASDNFNLPNFVKRTDFSKFRSRLDLLSHIILTAKAQEVAEIGVWKGEFASYILSSCKGVRKYYLIDPWKKLDDWNKPFNVESEMFSNIYDEAMDKLSFAMDRTVTLRGKTNEVIKDIPNNSLDIAYIDGDHTLKGITIDLINVLPKIKDNGLIVGDDFTETIWQHDRQFEPTLVCPFSVYFAEAHNLPIAALPYNQFIIQKSPHLHFSFTDITGKYKQLSLTELANLKNN